MTALHHLAIGQPYLAALVVLLVVVSIGGLVWIALPEAGARDRDADIDRQIATLRRHADHAVATRPRVRANGCAGQAGHINATKPKACGGGWCRHRADCSDIYCPGRAGADHHANH